MSEQPTKVLGGCEQAKADLGLQHAKCCNGCHDDEADGFEAFLDLEPVPGVNQWYMACCGVREAWEKKKQEPRDG